MDEIEIEEKEYKTGATDPENKNKDLRDVEDDTPKHRLFMEGKCIKCKKKIEPIPEQVYIDRGLLEFPLHNFNSCNGTLFHRECPDEHTT